MTSTATKTKVTTKTIKTKKTADNKTKGIRSKQNVRRTMLDRVQNQEEIPLPSKTLFYMACRSGISNPSNARLSATASKIFTDDVRRKTRASSFVAHTCGRQGITVGDVLLAANLLNKE